MGIWAKRSEMSPVGSERSEMAALVKPGSQAGPCQRVAIVIAARCAAGDFHDLKLPSPDPDAQKWASGASAQK